jgi:hypothetical protein
MKAKGVYEQEFESLTEAMTFLRKKGLKLNEDDLLSGEWSGKQVVATIWSEQGISPVAGSKIRKAYYDSVKQNH